MKSGEFKCRLSAILSDDEDQTIRILNTYCRTRDHRLRLGEKHLRDGGVTVESLKHCSREFSCSGAK